MTVAHIACVRMNIGGGMGVGMGEGVGVGVGAGVGVGVDLFARSMAVLVSSQCSALRHATPV